MSLIIFPFPNRLLDGSGGGLTFVTTMVPGNDTKVRRDETGADGLYRGRLSVILRTPAEIATWSAFVKNVRGAYDLWAFKEPLDTSLYISTSEALGTADGVQTDFALLYKYVDTANIIVYENGVPISASAFSIVTNETAPKVHYLLGAPTAAKVITATYQFYIPVSFTNTPPVPSWVAGGFEATINGMEIEEDYGGARLVNPAY